MRKVGIAFIAALATIVTPVFGQQSVSVASDAQHRLLETFAGEWSVKQSLWMMPGKPPKVDVGNATLQMILKGRHLRQTLRIADGTNFEGLSYFGYDNASKKFFSTWMDVNFPGIVVARGDLDPSSKAITLRGLMDADQADAATPVREVLTIVDQDHLQYDFYETHKGFEALVVRLEYTRIT